jgi:SHS2 domain-containing protein
MVDFHMSMNKTFEFLEHTADIYAAAYGRTLEEAFQNAALAMFESMTETRTIEPKIQDIIEINAEDKLRLLYSWLETLLLKFEVDEKLYSKFEIAKIVKTLQGFVLKATIHGEIFNPEKHPSKVGIKAVTYHQMAIIEQKNFFVVNFILDI